MDDGLVLSLSKAFIANTVKLCIFLGQRHLVPSTQLADADAAPLAVLSGPLDHDEGLQTELAVFGVLILLHVRGLEIIRNICFVNHSLI